MNYGSLKSMIDSGISFFSNGANFECDTGQGTVSIIGGVEVQVEPQKVMIHGFVRSPKQREVDGESIFITDKLGVFDSNVEIKNGYTVTIDGEKYKVIESRPVRQTNVTVAYRPILRRISFHG